MTSPPAAMLRFPAQPWETWSDLLSLGAEGLPREPRLLERV